MGEGFLCPNAASEGLNSRLYICEHNKTAKPIRWKYSDPSHRMRNPFIGYRPLVGPPRCSAQYIRLIHQAIGCQATDRDVAVHRASFDSAWHDVINQRLEHLTDSLNARISKYRSSG